MLDHINLYNNLMNLCKDPAHEDAFYYQDYTSDDKIYRIFNYRLVNWTTFQNAIDAKKCRGTMFEISNEPVLASLPPNKFFNYAEGDVDHTKNELIAIHVKLDGSLISTSMHNGTLRLKSKGSINSHQALNAMDWLSLPENEKYLKFLTHNSSNYTFNMEWTGPNNRIVVGYPEDKLSLLSIRNNITGEETYVYEDFLFNHAKSLPINNDNITELVNTMYLEEVGEGYVLSFRTPEGESYRTKVKNFKYCNLHKIKDSISNPEALAELIIRGGVDDVYDLFADDIHTINLIEDMENKVVPIFNHMVSQTEKFYFDNKHLIRKDYAIKAKAEAEILMPLLMNLYIEREISYEDFAVRNLHRLFGIKNVQKTY